MQEVRGTGCATGGVQAHNSSSISISSSSHSLTGRPCPLLECVQDCADHAVVCWCCTGPEFGLRYAANTPALVGCSGAVAAITAYKAALQPMGLPGMGLPMPIAVIGFLFCCLYIREAVSVAVAARGCLCPACCVC